MDRFAEKHVMHQHTVDALAVAREFVATFHG